MILEVAILDVNPEKTAAFDKDFLFAQEIIISMEGYQWHQLQKSVEMKNRYLLLVGWSTLEAHTIGFRQSEQYQKWKKLLHHYYDPFPVVEHYEKIYEMSASGKSTG